MKRKNLLLVYLIALFTCLTFCLPAAAASGRPYFPSSITLITSRKCADLEDVDLEDFKVKILPGNGKGIASYRVGLENDKRKMKIYNLKSSKPKVISVDKEQYGNKSRINFTYKNPGSANVSFKVKVGGRSYSYNVKVKVIKYTNPLKRITFGSKNLTSKFNKSDKIMLDPPVEGKLIIIPKPGWRIRLIINGRASGYEEFLKNGQTTRFGEKHVIQIRLENPALNARESLSINWNWK